MFASISDQLINTAIIMDMMFNTEMIVKVLKGGKEDMTENKRFLIDDAGELIDLNNHKFIDYGDECCKLLNKLHEENERLKKYNNKLMKQPLLFDVQTIPNTMEIMVANNKLEEENEQLKQHNTELINKIDFLEQVIDGDV